MLSGRSSPPRSLFLMRTFAPLCALSRERRGRELSTTFTTLTLSVNGEQPPTAVAKCNSTAEILGASFCTNQLQAAARRVGSVVSDVRQGNFW